MSYILVMTVSHGLDYLLEVSLGFDLGQFSACFCFYILVESESWDVLRHNMDLSWGFNHLVEFENILVSDLREDFNFS